MEKFKIKDLELVFARIIEKLNIEKVDEIDFSFDMYRSIPGNKLNVTFSEDKEYHVGSLVDDVEEIKKLVNERERPCTYVDFDRVANILRAVSEEKNPSI